MLASLSMPSLLSLMDSILVSQTSRTQLPPWYAHKVTYVIDHVTTTAFSVCSVSFPFCSDLLISLGSSDGSWGNILFVFAVCSTIFRASWCLGWPGSFHEFACDCWIYEVTFVPLTF